MSPRLPEFYVLYPDRKVGYTLTGTIAPTELRSGVKRIGQHDVVGVYNTSAVDHNESLYLMVRDHAEPFENYERYRSCFQRAGDYHRSSSQQVWLWTMQGLVCADTENSDYIDGKHVKPSMARASSQKVVTDDQVMREFLSEKLGQGHSFELIREFLNGVQQILTRGVLIDPSRMSGKLWDIRKEYWGSGFEKIAGLFDQHDDFAIEAVALRLASSCQKSE